jgi:hypothetical protein
LQRENQSLAAKGGAISQASIDRTELSLFLRSLGVPRTFLIQE